jgi:hypothetical protein
MTEPAGLEHRYRRLLAWYPAAFRGAHEDEMVAVLMAGARRGQRRPGLLESADLIRSAVAMRLRLIGPGSQDRPWADALALFSVAGPLLLLLATIFEVALPYRVPLRTRIPGLAHFLGAHPEIGGLHFLSSQRFDIALGCQVVIAALVVLGLRWAALAAIAGSAVCWIVGLYAVPDLLQVLSASVYMLAAAALIASPGPRRGRQLLSWRHGIVLLLVAAAVQASTLMYDATSPFVRFLAQNPLDGAGYFVVSVVLAAAAATLAVAWRMNRYFLLLLGVMFYPYVLQLAFPTSSSDNNLIGHPTPGHLAGLFLPPLLLACGAILGAVAPRRSRPPLPPGPDHPRPT